MKYSFRLLKRYLPELTESNIQEIVDKLSMQLAEVEGVENTSDNLKRLLVAKVVDVRKHPNSNKLYIVHVDIGGRIVQVVAGAGNMKIGDYVPYTPVGVRVPRNAYPERFDGVVRKIKLAGEVSEGMLNSEFELGISDDHKEILVLNDLANFGIKLESGMSLSKALEYDDYLIEIENKAMTHRGDVFSHIGLAQEISAILGIDFNYEEAVKRSLNLFFNSVSEASDLESDGSNLNINMGEIHKDCWQYNLYYLRVDNTKKTPLLIKSYLSKFGIGVVNYIVDLLNLVTILIGQPMHAFDLEKLNKLYGKDLTIEVKYKNKGILKALDKKSYNITAPTLCITVNDHPVAFAGVIGGMDSAVDPSTKEVLLEIATFSYAPIRRTSMQYGLNTYSSVIYARQQSTQKIEDAYSILKGIFPNIVKVSSHINKKTKPSEIKINVNFINNFVGQPIDKGLIKTSLKSLGLSVKEEQDELIVTSSPYRLDLNIKEDLVEEIVRIVGYNTIKPKLPASVPVKVNSDKKIDIRKRINEIMIARGYFESVGYGFFSDSILDTFDFDPQNHYKIVNAISPEVSFFRSSIYPQLVRKIDKNLQYSSKVKLYEIGHIAHKSLIDSFDDTFRYHDNSLMPKESFHLAGVIAGKQLELSYLLSEISSDVLSLRPLLEIRPLFEISEIEDPYWKEMVRPLNKWNAGIVMLNDSIIGIIGGLRTQVKIKATKAPALGVFEIDLVPLFNIYDYNIHNSVNVPAVYEDYSFVVSMDISFYTMQHELKSCVKQHLQDLQRNKNIYVNIELLDIYYPKNKEDTRYITFRLYFISEQQELLSEEVEALRKEILNCIKRNLGVELKTIKAE